MKKVKILILFLALFLFLGWASVYKVESCCKNKSLWQSLNCCAHSINCLTSASCGK
ncbi:MAG TPA: hypothetical protein VJ165_00320 [candidate division Zixibacteria bacterium]|nr:hypothetical protein [candidate division Zixibacteria bacterium]